MTAPKTDDEIARDKEAVAKMKGAKDAMEAALRRINTLELVLDKVAAILIDTRKRIAPDHLVKTYHHAGRDQATIPLQEQVQYAIDRISQVR